MSRDWKPYEWDLAHKEIPQLDPLNNNITIKYNGEEKPLHDEEEFELFKTYSHLRLCGLDFLLRCKYEGITDSEKGRQILHEVENILNHEIKEEYRDLADKVDLWYQGQLVPGHYMDNNNEELVSYIKQYMKE